MVKFAKIGSAEERLISSKIVALAEKHPGASVPQLAYWSRAAGGQRLGKGRVVSSLREKKYTVFKTGKFEQSEEFRQPENKLWAVSFESEFSLGVTGETGGRSGPAGTLKWTFTASDTVMATSRENARAEVGDDLRARVEKLFRRHQNEVVGGAKRKDHFNEHPIDKQDTWRWDGLRSSVFSKKMGERGKWQSWEL